MGTILALDVGFTKMGWCVFVDGSPSEFGIIKPMKSGKKNVRTSDDRAYRAAFLATEMRLIIGDCGVEGCVGELPGGGAQSAKAMAAMAAGTAVASSVIVLHQLPVEWVTPMEVKMALCGKRNASKVDVMDAVRKLYPDVEWPKAKAKFEDVADAVGAYHASRDGNIVRMFGGGPQKSP